MTVQILTPGIMPAFHKTLNFVTSYAHFAFFWSNYYEMQKLGTTFANSLVRNELPRFFVSFATFPQPKLSLSCYYSEFNTIQ